MERAAQAAYPHFADVELLEQFFVSCRAIRVDVVAVELVRVSHDRRLIAGRRVQAERRVVASVDEPFDAGRRLAAGDVAMQSQRLIFLKWPNLGRTDFTPVFVRNHRLGRRNCVDNGTIRLVDPRGEIAPLVT